MPMKQRRGPAFAALITAPILAVVLAAVGCGSDKGASSDGGPTDPSPTAPGSATVVLSTGAPNQTGPDGPRQTTSAGTSTSGTSSTAPSSPSRYTPPATSAIPPARYPVSVPDYAKAVVAAWEGGDGADVLQSLMTQSGYLQLTALRGHGPNTYLRCSGSPVSACPFVNEDGDVLTIRVTNSLVGRAHAAIGATLDRTAYPTSAPDYVQAFIDAWEFGNIARMRRYATSAVIDVLGPAPASPGVPTPACCASPGFLLIAVSFGRGQATFEVATSRLGLGYAIIGYSSGS